jgi:Uma2 family endonuclease
VQGLRLRQRTAARVPQLTPPHDYTGVSNLRTEPFTRTDYDQLPEGFPAQLIDGMLVKEPAPSLWHQEIVKRVFRALDSVIDSARIFFAPADVYLDDRNVFQPDVLVFEQGVSASPGKELEEIPILVVEVLSPETAKWDRQGKPQIYLGRGVIEVWIVDPGARTVEIRQASGGETVATGERASSEAVPGFSIATDDLFRS